MVGGTKNRNNASGHVINQELGLGSCAYTPFKISVNYLR